MDIETVDGFSGHSDRLAGHGREPAPHQLDRLALGIERLEVNPYGHARRQRSQDIALESFAQIHNSGAGGGYRLQRWDAGCVQNLVNSALIPLVESTVTLITMFLSCGKLSLPLLGSA
jgi:hypothetical protein